MSEGKPPRRGYLSREDMMLWAHVTHSVRPFQGRTAFVLPEEMRPPVPVADKPGPPAAPLLPRAAGSPPALPPLQPLERRMRQRLARGQREVEGVIDLHGMRQNEAHAALLGFIHRAHREGCTLVLVITGKGPVDPDAREGRGVLARMVPHWLADPVIRREVVGYEPAARGHGGTGALYVRIRKPRGADLT